MWVRQNSSRDAICGMDMLVLCGGGCCPVVAFVLLFVWMVVLKLM